MGDDVPFTVAEVIHRKTVAYPDVTVNDWPGRKSADPTQYKDQIQSENHFVSVQSVVVDPANRLWVLDTGSPMLKNALPGGPKLVAIDLTTNKIIKRILLPPSIAGPTSYMNDVRFDLRIGSAAGADGIHGIAYITDSSEKGPTGFVIVDLATGQAWRKLDNTASVKPEPGVVSHAMWRNSSQIIWRKQGSFDPREAATGDSKRSDLTDDQVLACGLDHCGGEVLELIDLEHSFHLGQQACN